MTWGPVRADWQEQGNTAWRERKLTAQRKRRASCRRIDYYPSEEAVAVIDSLTNHKQIDGVYSRVIDRLILSAASKYLPEFP